MLKVSIEAKLLNLSLVQLRAAALTLRHDLYFPICLNICPEIRHSSSAICREPPGIPEDRLEALRTAFDKSVADPIFIADAKRSGIDITPLDGKSIAKLVDEVMTTPQSVVDRLNKTLAGAPK